jgi:predicted MPP superfamily phosphohydrolase
MRLLVTADLHYNHRKSHPLADALIERMNGLDADALLVVGDTAPAESQELAQCLSRFTLKRPKLFVAGNHEL